MVTVSSGEGARRGFRAMVRLGVVDVEPRPVERVGRGEVRVAVEYAALGSYPPSDRDGPIGQEYSGRIVEVGAEVDPSRVGSRVVGLVRAGSVASEVVVPAASAYPLADRFNPVTAPLSLTVGLCAVSFDLRFEIGPGRVALLLAPTNGTGCLFASMVRHRGGTAIAWTTDRSAEPVLSASGFAAVIVSDKVPDAATLVAHTDGALADLVVGGRMQPEAPWDDIVPLLEDDGIAVRRPATSLGDWDPKRALVYSVLDDVLPRLWSGEGSVEAALAPVLNELGDHLLSGRYVMPTRLFELAEIQTAFDLSLDAHIPEGIIVRMSPT